MTVIVDAGVAIKWFVREPGHEQALALLRAQDVEAPDHVLTELADLAWHKQQRGEMTRAQAQAVACRAAEAFTRLHSSAELLPRAAEMAQWLRRPVSECLPLACAAATGTPLVTGDASLCRGLQGGDMRGLVMPLQARAGKQRSESAICLAFQAV